MIVYLDSSAAVKLVIHEPESRALIIHLSACKDRGDRVFTSWLAQTELMRAAQRAELPLDLAIRALETMEIVGLTRDVFVDAGLLPGKHLRSLDALHIAVARRLEVSEFISYDSAQKEAALQSGLAVVSPA